MNSFHYGTGLAAEDMRIRFCNERSRGKESLFFAHLFASFLFLYMYMYMYLYLDSLWLLLYDVAVASAFLS